VLQNFNANSQNRNIGIFSRIENAIAENRLQQATQLLNHLQPQNTAETNTKSYLTVYLNHKLNRFTVQDSLELIRLSNGCVARDGFAVTRARALYRLKSKDFTNFFNDCGNQIAPRLLDALSANSNRGFEIYPNPNDGNMMLAYQLETNEKGKITVCDITGRQVISYNLANDQNNLSISQAALENGVYFFSIMVDGNVVATKKVVIIK
jgi:hypothetical protein